MIQHQIIGTYLQGNVKQLEGRINNHIVGVNRLNFVSCKQVFFVKKKPEEGGWKRNDWYKMPTKSYIFKIFARHHLFEDKFAFEN